MPLYDTQRFLCGLDSAQTIFEVEAEVLGCVAKYRVFTLCLSIVLSIFSYVFHMVDIDSKNFSILMSWNITT